MSSVNEDPVDQMATTRQAPIVFRDLGVWTFVCFLFGNSNAIWSVARAKHGWLLGAILVLSAGLAREYNRSDLLAEPIHLLIPFAASVATSFALYFLVNNIAWFKLQQDCPSLSEFLQCYWATAPLAWIYALPVERWFDAEGAVKANYELLEIVAVWRVLIMIRVVQTLWSAKLIQSAAMVLAFGHLVLICALQFLPVPILDIMAGNNMGPADRAAMFIYIGTTLYAWVSAPVLAVALLLVMTTVSWGKSRMPDPSARSRVAWTLWGISSSVIALGVWLCVIEQPSLRAATTVRQLVSKGRYSDAIEFLTKHFRSDFPPHWNLPPSEFREPATGAPIHLVKFFLAVLQLPESPDWVKQDLQIRVIRAVPYFGNRITDDLRMEELESLVEAIELADASGVEFGPLHHFYFGEKKARPRDELITRLEKVYSKHMR